MYDRLLNKKKPVDLGFAILEPLPVRADWLERYVKPLPRGEVYRKRLWGMLRVMGCALARMASGAVCWTIVVRHTKQWWRGVQQVEKRSQHKPAYINNLIRFLNERKETLNACIREYRSQARRPSVGFDPGRVRRSLGPLGRPRLAQLLKYRKRRKRGGPLDPFVGSNIAPLAVGRKVKNVSRVPRVRSETQDVRFAGEEVVQPGNEENGAGGLPLSGGIQEPPTGE